MLNALLTTIAQAQADNDRQFVTALARGLTILVILRAKPQGLSHQQICELAQLPKGTVSRLLHTLQQLNFIERDNDTLSYRASSLLLSFGESATIDDYVVKKITPLMQDFAHHYEVSVSLSCEKYGDMYYIQTIRSPARIAVQLSTGSHIPIAGTSAGRAYFAAASEEVKARILDYIRQRNPKDYQARAATLQKQQDYFNKNGYTYSDGDFSEEIMAVATTVRYAIAKNGLYALSASIPAVRKTLPIFVAEIATPLQQLATTIENHLEHNIPSL